METGHGDNCSKDMEQESNLMDLSRYSAELHGKVLNVVFTLMHRAAVAVVLRCSVPPSLGALCLRCLSAACHAYHHDVLR